MKLKRSHAWDVDASTARRLQNELRSLVTVDETLDLNDVQLVAGVDNAYQREPATAFAAIVVLHFPSLEPAETVVASVPVTFPYVPGLLTFREAPAIIAALAKLESRPDVFLFDGQGTAHFRRFGLASHMGVLLDMPSIGCAKSKLVGTYEEPGNTFGDWTDLIFGGKVVGAAVRTSPSHSPLFVSPGTKISVASAVDTVLACCRAERFLPEPTRLAHNTVTEHAHPR